LARKDEFLQMRIGESKHRDVGKKRARIGPDAMDFLKVTPGDVIEISCSKSSCAVVWPADEDEKHSDVIRIDGQTRKNVGAALNDIVKIKKVSTKVAKTVVLIPVNDSVTVDKEFTDFVKNRLKGLPLSHSDEISVMILGNSMDFKINKISPKNVVKIDSLKELEEIKENAISLNVPWSEVTDAGHTQIEPGTTTCISVGPAPEDIVDKITGNLKLL